MKITNQNTILITVFTRAFYTMFLNSPEIALKAMNRLPA